MGAVVTILLWRLVFMWKDIYQATSTSQRRKAAARHFAYLFMDIVDFPFVIASLIITITLWRAYPLWKGITGIIFPLLMCVCVYYCARREQEPPQEAPFCSKAVRIMASRYPHAIRLLHPDDHRLSRQVHHPRTKASVFWISSTSSATPRR